MPIAKNWGACRFGCVQILLESFTNVGEIIREDGQDSLDSGQTGVQRTTGGTAVRRDGVCEPHSRLPLEDLAPPPLLLLRNAFMGMGGFCEPLTHLGDSKSYNIEFMFHLKKHLNGVKIQIPTPGANIGPSSQK